MAMPPLPPPQSRPKILSRISPVAVDCSISIAYYFRIADALLLHANICRKEKSVLELDTILRRHLSLLCETVPSHPDYHAFTSRNNFWNKSPHNIEKIVNVLNELEALEPVVQRQMAELNGQSGAYVATGGANASSRTDEVAQSSNVQQPLVGSPTVSLKKPFSGREHQVELTQSANPDDSQLVESFWYCSVIFMCMVVSLYLL